MQQARLTNGARIGILGLGPIGRTVHLAAIDAGCGPAYTTDLIEARCASARDAGIHCVVNPRNVDAVAEILDREPLGLDVVFECCGQQAALDQAVELLRPGGTLVMIGIPEVDQIYFRPEQIRRRELTLVNIRRQRGCVQAALDLISRRRTAVRDLITHRFPFAESKAAFDMVANYRDGVVKAMIEFL